MKRRQFAQNLVIGSSVLTLAPLRKLAAQTNFPLGNTNTSTAKPATTASGVVYGVRKGRKFPLPQVRVTNGQEVVVTDRLGRYKLPVQDGDIISVVKPRGYALPINALNLPQFHYIHKPEGSPRQAFTGVTPTGALPTSIDFTLQAQEEPDEFRVLLFGDPQSRNQEEIGYLMGDIIEDVAGQKAAFGVSLGDIAFDDLSIYQNHNRAIATLGMPWFNVAGNHDMNYDAAGREDAMETYKSIYGPNYYSFDYGPAHFVVLDDVAYDGLASAAEGKKKGTYHTELGARQLAWLANDLKFVPKDKLVVFMMHIPLVNPEGEVDSPANCKDLAAFFSLIKDRPNTLSISAHTHFQEHMFLGKEYGWPGAGAHHHFNSVTTCGSWWGGVKDERGIPHTTMRDGAPNGYSFLNIKGNQYTIDFKAARRPESYQMNIYAPIEVPRTELAKTEVVANIFAGSPKSKVEMHLGNGKLLPMQKVDRVDPAYETRLAFEEPLPKEVGRKLPKIINSPHLWTATLPTDLPVGAHLIHVRTTDMWGRTYEDRRIVRVV